MNIINYQNRKLYNKDTSTYVTIPEILTHVRTGGEVKATCHVTRTDVTDQVLKRCIEYKTNLYKDELYAFLRQ